MAPPLSRSIVGVSSSAKALRYPCAPSSFSTTTSAAFIRFGSRRGFRCEVSSARLGAFGGECSMERASFTSARFCSCREVLAHDCMFSRGYSFLREEQNVFICNSLKNIHFSTDTSDPRVPPGLDDNDVEPPNDNLLVDCGPDQECVIGGIVALGKFDALHLGHRQLAIQASRAGTPFLLSFVGIAEVLGWEYRAPIVAKSDRKRVLSMWAPLCGNVVPLEFHVEFSRVRHLSPREFVERLSKDLRISGVVAGENYRFGYRASGDATELVDLCQEYGLEAHILSSVVDGNEPVSSTRVREALAMGDMDDVAQLLGRRHRLALRLPEYFAADGGKILSVPRTWALNQEPKEGLYKDCSLLVSDEIVGPCHVTIDQSHFHVELLDGSWPRGEHHLLGIDFGR